MSEELVRNTILNYPDIHRVALDIGANHGSYAFEMCNRPFAHTYAVEPHPDNIKILLDRFKDQPHVTVVGKAIIAPGPFLGTCGDNKIKLYTNQNPGGHSVSEKVSHNSAWGHCKEKWIEVEAITLDELWAQIKDRGQTIGLIKMDIEGAEDTVWQCAVELLKDNIDWLTIVVEIHQTVDLPGFQQFFADLGYSIGSQTEPKVKHLSHDNHYLIQKALAPG